MSRITIKHTPLTRLVWTCWEIADLKTWWKDLLQKSPGWSRGSRTGRQWASWQDTSPHVNVSGLLGWDGAWTGVRGRELKENRVLIRKDRVLNRVLPSQEEWWWGRAELHRLLIFPRLAIHTHHASSLGKSELKRPERPEYSEKNLPSQRMGAGERHCTPTLRKHDVFYLRCLSCKKESGMRWFFKVLFIFDCVVVILQVTKGIAEEGLISCLWFLSMRGSVFAFQEVCFND